MFCNMLPPLQAFVSTPIYQTSPTYPAKGEDQWKPNLPPPGATLFQLHAGTWWTSIPRLTGHAWRVAQQVKPTMGGVHGWK